MTQQLPGVPRVFLFRRMPNHMGLNIVSHFHVTLPREKQMIHY